MANGIANGMAPAGWPTESQTGWRPPDCQRNRKLDGTRRIGKRRHTAPSGACLTQPTGLPVGNRPISISRAPKGAACQTDRIVIVTYNPARGPFGGAMLPPHPIPRASPWADYSKRPRALSATRLGEIAKLAMCPRDASHGLLAAGPPDCELPRIDNSMPPENCIGPDLETGADDGAINAEPPRPKGRGGSYVRVYQVRLFLSDSAGVGE